MHFPMQQLPEAPKPLTPEQLDAVERLSVQDLAQLLIEQRTTHPREMRTVLRKLDGVNASKSLFDYALQRAQKTPAAVQIVAQATAGEPPSTRQPLAIADYLLCKSADRTEWRILHATGKRFTVAVWEPGSVVPPELGRAFTTPSGHVLTDVRLIDPVDDQALASMLVRAGEWLDRTLRETTS
jgi:hypothetical protein